MEECDFHDNSSDCPSFDMGAWRCNANTSGKCEIKECPFMFWGKIFLKKIATTAEAPDKEI